MAWHFYILAVIFSLSCLLFQRNRRPSPRGTVEEARTVSVSKVKQPYDAFLLLDVEATCQRGADFNYPNEIIEFPVCLMRWKDRDGGSASQLEITEEFRSFVKPSWRPILSEFCTELTGITQEQVDAAPDFPAVLRSFRAFLVKHKLIEKNGKRRLRFCWCSDGPFDIRDFVVKQCFISQVPIPNWMTGDVLDVRALVMAHTSGRQAHRGPFPKIATLNIPGQLLALGLPQFLGRQHSGIDDARNLARILKQLALEGISLQPNTSIKRRRWVWMGKSGKILEEHLTS